ncbi:hypothetical protein CDAR_75031 [Caerostris darwini]|uniref:Uncharacterized protein n=1 Tax=Caerostris darwini TaxID=1538125 RepID=A0AAV4P2W8_9ARAC|nr:hypothetical protein CDAR_75031 [Caerostris darwini]
MTGRPTYNNSLRGCYSSSGELLTDVITFSGPSYSVPLLSTDSWLCSNCTSNIPTGKFSSDATPNSIHAMVCFVSHRMKSRDGLATEPPASCHLGMVCVARLKLSSDHRELRHSANSSFSDNCWMNSIRIQFLQFYFSQIQFDASTIQAVLIGG